MPIECRRPIPPDLSCRSHRTRNSTEAMHIQRRFYSKSALQSETCFVKFGQLTRSIWPIRQRSVRLVQVWLGNYDNFFRKKLGLKLNVETGCQSMIVSGPGRGNVRFGRHEMSTVRCQHFLLLLASNTTIF
jgi:hypothetical protein